VHVLGNGSEPLHDAIDRVSARLGRQVAVGDGVPITSWNDDLATVDEMAAFIVLGGLGAASALIAIVVGEDTQFDSMVDAWERQVSAQHG